MSYRIKGNTGDWEVVIGLEVHAQVISKSKLFSGAATTAAPTGRHLERRRATDARLRPRAAGAARFHAPG